MNAKDSTVKAAFDLFCSGQGEESLKAGVVLNYLLKKPFIDGLNIAEGCPYATNDSNYYEFSGELACVRLWWCTCNDYTTSLYTQPSILDYGNYESSGTKVPWGGQSTLDDIPYCKHLVAAAVLANGKVSGHRLKDALRLNLPT